VTWEQNPESNVTAYRVFIGTSAGSYAETFDVPAAQSSFVYSGAVPGKRYFVAVAAQLDHATWGPRSTEVSEVAVATQQSVPSLMSFGAPAAAAGRLTTAAASGSSTAATGIQVVATGLQPVSAVAVSAAGLGLFVEGGHVVRVFENPGRGMQAAPALALDDDVQIQDIALDPAFDRTGRAFLAVSRTGRDGAREVALERHRLRGGGLGESTVLVPALDGALAERTLLAATGTGAVIVAQSGLVRAFAGTDLVRLGEGPTHPVSIFWDDINQTAWVTGTAAAGTPTVERLNGKGAANEMLQLPASLADSANSVAIAQAGTSGRVAVAGASAGALIQFEPATGATTTLTEDLAAYGVPVLVAAPSHGDASWYVVLRAGGPGRPTSDTLIRVAAGSGAPRPIH
jgi:hypothetical protein